MGAERDSRRLEVNRAPVLALWATVVAEHLGFEPEEALSLGRAITALTAQAKGRRLGIFHPRERRDVERVRRTPPGERVEVQFMGRRVPMVRTERGLLAVLKGEPVDPQAARRYIESRFGDRLPEVRAAMNRLASALPPQRLAEEAFDLYVRFRPQVPPGRRGWGAKGVLDLDRIEALARELEQGRE